MKKKKIQIQVMSAYTLTLVLGEDKVLTPSNLTPKTQLALLIIQELEGLYTENSFYKV